MSYSFACLTIVLWAIPSYFMFFIQQPEDIHNCEEDVADEYTPGLLRYTLSDGRLEACTIYSVEAFVYNEADAPSEGFLSDGETLTKGDYL